MDKFALLDCEVHENITQDCKVGIAGIYSQSMDLAMTGLRHGLPYRSVPYSTGEVGGRLSGRKVKIVVDTRRL